MAAGHAASSVDKRAACKKESTLSLSIHDTRVCVCHRRWGIIIYIYLCYYQSLDLTCLCYIGVTAYYCTASFVTIRNFDALNSSNPISQLQIYSSH